MNPRCMPKSYDIRVAERLINHGILSREELNDHIASLPDLQGQAMSCDTNWPGEPAKEEPEVTESEADNK